MWLCPACSTTNRDEDETCFVCGARKSAGRYSGAFLSEVFRGSSGDHSGRRSGGPSGGRTWLCPVCSTVNNGENTACFVCGAARPEGEHSEDSGRDMPDLSEEEGDDGEEREDCPEDDYAEDDYTEGEEERPREVRVRERVPARRRTLPRAAAISAAVMALLFLAGQALMYGLYFGHGGFVLGLSKILRAAANESFIMPAYLGCMSFIGAVAAAAFAYRGYTLLDERDCGCFVSLAVFFGIGMVAMPALFAPVAFVFAIVIMARGEDTEDIIGYLAAFLGVLLAATGICMFTLSAKYILTFNGNGGMGGTQEAFVRENGSMSSVVAPEREGHQFLGYFDSPEGGKMYFDEFLEPVFEVGDIDHNVTLYAHWQAEVYTVYLYANGGEGGTYSVQVSCGYPMPAAAAPERTGHEFLGYYSSEGTQYYDGNMNSVTEWDVAAGGSLHARWQAATYSVFLNANGGYSSVGSVKATYGMPLPAAAAPVRDDYRFLGYYLGDVQYYDGDMNGVRDWDVAGSARLTALWELAEYTVTLNKNGGAGGADSVTVIYGHTLPAAAAPERTGYEFLGYYSSEGTQYYDEDMNGTAEWDMYSGGTLYARWQAKSYRVTLNKNGGTGGAGYITVTYGKAMPAATAPTRSGYVFLGYYSSAEGGTQYYSCKMSSARSWDIASGTTLYARWRLPVSASLSQTSFNKIKDSVSATLSVANSTDYSVSVSSYHPGVDCSFSSSTGKLTIKKKESDQSGTITLTVTDNVCGDSCTVTVSYTTSGTCIAAGTLVTLADGSAVPVESLTGSEQLLVWNFFTGKACAAPILFVEENLPQLQNIITLTFSNGSTVRIAEEHAFFSRQAGRFLFLREDAAQYIGTEFCVQGQGGLTFATLTNVKVAAEYVAVYSPVPVRNLAFFVNGVLSAPANVQGFVDIFRTDLSCMAYNRADMAADIAKYGLLTYEQFVAMGYDVPEEIFYAFCGEYLSVSLGKGLITAERLEALIGTYAQYLYQ